MTATHVPGKTTETPQRPPQDFTQSIQHLDLQDECARLLAEAAINPSHRAAKTLSKDSSMSVTILAITKGTGIQDHPAHGSAVLQTLVGQVRVSVSNTEIDLPTGHMITLASHVPHQLSAAVDSAVLFVVTGDR